MRVVLFYLGDYPVRSYGIVVVLAILLSIGIARYLARETVYREHISSFAVTAIISALFGARLWEVLFFQWEYYSSRPLVILAIWNGGLSIQGAIVGGIFSAIYYTWRHKLSFWDFADTLAPAVVFGQGIGRIACFLNGDAFGSPTGSNFGIVYPEGTIAYERYGSQPLWPAEIWEGQWDFIIFGILVAMKTRNLPKGILFVTYQALYALGRFALEFLRGDTPRYWLDWTAAQWTSFAIIVLMSMFAIAIIFREKRGHVS
ncbi:prolipoprotein diacylglyceryl transferase [Brevibacillus agri]|uniref:prolipoprotein diacylglyceryl transferase n=1 Tax=Brevibacillus agri TaxID=51101 RepID=UPI0018CEE12C|nr:prolipoprotein diacylglyceryl transferase [Brevibacillus agri]MBG9567117.1 diacylglyceryl transferase [Brevibacillus agri]